jgi:hypothetical protein
LFFQRIVVATSVELENPFERIAIGMTGTQVTRLSFNFLQQVEQKFLKARVKLVGVRRNYVEG